MNRAFEDRLITFIEGGMDAADRSGFLNEVHADPEKLEIFTQYLQLDDAIELSRRPSPVPIELQQALAMRIPVLSAIIPPGAPSAAAAQAAAVGEPVQTASRFKLRTAIITIGLLLLATASYISLERFEWVGSELRKTVNADQVRSSTATAAASVESSAASVESSAASVESSAASVERSDEARPTKTSSVGRAQEAGARSTGVLSSQSSSLTGRLTGRTGPMDSPSPVTGGVGSIRTTNGVRENSWPAARPLHAITPNQDGRRTTTVPLSEMVGLTFGKLSPALTVYLQSGVQQALAERTSDRTAGGIPRILLAGIRYEITPRFSAALEVGESPFLQEALYEERKALAGGNNADILVIDRELIPDTRNWLRLQFGYQLFDVASWQLELRGGSGILLGKENALLFTSGVMANYPLSQVLLARIGVQYTVARLGPGNTVALDPAAGEGIVGIIEKANTARATTGSGVEFNLGFGLRLW